MPNQRKPGKKRVGVWLTDDERASLNQAAKNAGCSNIADFMRLVISDAQSPPETLRAAEDPDVYKSNQKDKDA